MIVGAPSSGMELELYGVSDGFLLKMDDNNALLGSYPVDDECKIHVCRRFSALLWPECLFLTEKWQDTLVWSFFFILFFFQVIDQSGQQMGEFTDVSQVEKFEISNQAYEKRTGGVRLTFSLIVNPIWLKFSITFFFLLLTLVKKSNQISHIWLIWKKRKKKIL